MNKGPSITGDQATFLTPRCLVIDAVQMSIKMLEKKAKSISVPAVLEKAKSEGRTTLNEAESKQVLQLFGVPVVREAIIKTSDEAAAFAATHGYPVVLKGMGAGLNHKTERGLVYLDLKSQQDIGAAMRALNETGGKDLQNFLIQPMVSGKREYIAGLFCDPHFGPVVMFGLGGIFAEVMGDVVFRVAPFAETEAEQMITELQSTALLRNFRGEKAADRDLIVRTLVGLSRIAIDYPEITEVDINPLIIGSYGDVTAVDALIAIGTPSRGELPKPLANRSNLKPFFSPVSVAFVGASKRVGKWGNLLFSYALEGGFAKKVYLVNREGGTIADRKVYKSVQDIPGDIDLAVVTVPAARVLDLIPDFKAKNIHHMLLISSGFSDAGAVGKKLEEKLVSEAEDAGILVIGPNTMGLCNPHAKFYCAGSPTWPKAGSVALVSQSGNLGTQILAFAERENIGIRMFCGSGNEAMVTIEDFLDVFEHDALTKTVLMYVESVKAGGRFLKQAASVSRKKPIIVLKGGRSAVGSRAAASHTGAMAADTKVFEAACRQSGIVTVHHPTDLLDLAAAFSSLPLPRGNRIAIVTIGGGWGIVAADLCVDAGLAIPRMEKSLMDMISDVLPPYWSHENPVDLAGEFDPLLAMKVIQGLIEWDGCDAVIHLGITGRKSYVENSLRAGLNANPGVAAKIEHRALTYFAKAEWEIISKTAQLMASFNKPVVGVTLMPDEIKTVTDVPGCIYKGVAFPTPERAVNVLARMVWYQKWLNTK